MLVSIFLLFTLLKFIYLGLHYKTLVCVFSFCIALSATELTQLWSELHWLLYYNGICKWVGYI